MIVSAAALADSAQDRCELGPLLSVERAEDSEDVLVRPLLRWRRDDESAWRRLDVLYPFIKFERRGEERSERVLPFYYRMERVDVRGRKETDSASLPFVYWGSSSDGDENYVAVIPIAGRFYDFLGQDEVRFVLFPAYARRWRGDTVTTDVLYPFFGYTQGDDESGFRVWPFYGRKVKGGELAHMFVLWPFYTRQRQVFRDGDEAESLLIFPFYARRRSENQEITSYAVPFISFETNHRLNYKRTTVPYPFVTITRGEERNGLRLWPFWGKERVGESESGFVAWPFCTYSRTVIDEVGERRTRRVFLYVDDLSSREKDDTSSRYTQLWPLFDFTRSRDGARSFRALSPIWFRHSEEFDDNYGAFWTLYARETTEDGCGSVKVLGGLFRHEVESTKEHSETYTELFPLASWRRSEDETHLSFLKGTLAYHRTVEKRQLRLFGLVRVGL